MRNPRHFQPGIILPPGPRLPEEVVAKTTAKYLEAYERLTGRAL